MDYAELKELALEFQIHEEITKITEYGCGHINATYLIETDIANKYILQKINHTIFENVEGLMNNICLVTDFLKQKSTDPRSVMSVVKLKTGANYLKRKGEYWRIYTYIEDSICLQQPETEEDFYESAVAFGSFENKLSDFPVEQLVEIIPDFHNTPNRYRLFREVLENDIYHRAAGIQKEIEFYLSHEEEMGILQAMREAKELPDRVTHNDTKLNNVLLDKNTRKSLCVIDLDTIMPGLSLYDYGDSIRFGASTAAEDEKDLTKVELDLRKFKVFTEGFVKSCSGLTDREIEMLPMGAKTMTLECGLRFLTDYLDGDHYFAIHHPEQNLDRARAQMKLVQDMEHKWEDMVSVVREIKKESEH